MNDVDLHLHSVYSDGVLTPKQLIELLVINGVRTCALTDHDTVAGLPEATAAAADHGLRLINGIELSTQWQGRTLHVLGLGIEQHADAMTHAVEARRTLRHVRAAEIAHRLDRAGAPGSAALEAFKDHPAPTRTHFARALVALGSVENEAAAFKRWLGADRPGHVPTHWPALTDTVTTILACGGIPVLAHPLRYRLSAGQRRTLMKAFRAAGGIAIEVVTGGAAPHQIEAAAGLALRADLEGSIGSDCHDPTLPWHRPGRLAKLPSILAPVWHRWDLPVDRPSDE